MVPGTAMPCSEPQMPVFRGKAGSRVAITINIDLGEGGTWDDMVVTSHVRAAPTGGSLLATATVAVEPSGSQATLTWVLEGSQTAILPDVVYTDIRIQRAAPAFGPVISPTIKIILEPAVTVP